MTTPSQALPRPALSLILTRAASSLGTQMATFGLNVWIYQRTGSYAVFAYLALLAAMPSLVLAPFAGVLIDRSNKKSVLFGCELSCLLASLIALAAYRMGVMSTWVVAVVMFVLSCAAAVRWLVMGVTVSLLVPKAQRSRVNGLQQALQGFNVVASPMLGAAVAAAMGLEWLLVADAVTCAIALAGLWTLDAAPLVPNDSQAAKGATEGFWREFGAGFSWIGRHRPLRRLLLFFMFFNLGVTVFGVAFTPLVMHKASSGALGACMAAQGAGGLVVGMWLSRRPLPMAPISVVLAGAASYGLVMIAWGLSRQAAPLYLLSFLVGGLTSAIMASSQTVWQAQVPVAIQGKVFAVRMMVSLALGPVAILASVPAAHLAFLPLLQASPGIALAWGSGPQGALSLMVSSLGAAIVAGCLALRLAGGGLAPRDDLSSPPEPAQPAH